MIRQGVEGWLVPPDDPAALARALEEALADPDRARAMGAAGRKRFLEEFLVDKMVARTRAVYAVCKVARGTKESPSGR